ncbi:MAG: cache domain-containing protein [Micropepsaceae bacterium]
MSMRSKITAAFAMCISLPMAAGMGALWLGTEDTLQQQATQDLQTMTHNVMTSIEQQLAQNLTHLKAWSAMPMMQEVLISDEGGELSRALSDLNLNYADFASLTITNAQGQVISTTDPALRKADLSAVEGVHAAVSGRTTQSNLSKLREGGSETIQFTVPLVASYDRQTVIGTLTGVVDFSTLVRRIVQNSPLNLERRAFVLAQKDSSKFLYSSRSLDSVADEIQRIDTNRKNQSNELVIAGETHLAAFAKSGSKILVRDPGLVAFGVEPTSSVYAAADKVSNIFIAVAGLAAVLALVIAWQWSTPLVQLAASIGRLAHGDLRVSAPDLPRHSTFAPLVRALETMKEVKVTRDHLAARELELVQANETTLAELRNKERQLHELGRTLQQHMSDIAELCELINKENLAAASGKRHLSNAQDLSRTAVRLLSIVQDAVAASDTATEEQKSSARTEAPALQLLSA